MEKTNQEGVIIKDIYNEENNIELLESMVVRQ